LHGKQVAAADDNNKGLEKLLRWNLKLSQIRKVCYQESRLSSWQSW
jgi:hypothetical protein